MRASITCSPVINWRVSSGFICSTSIFSQLWSFSMMSSPPNRLPLCGSGDGDGSQVVDGIIAWSGERERQEHEAVARGHEDRRLGDTRTRIGGDGKTDGQEGSRNPRVEADQDEQCSQGFVQCLNESGDGWEWESETAKEFDEDPGLMVN